MPQKAEQAATQEAVGVCRRFE